MTNRRGMLSGLMAALVAPFVRRSEAVATDTVTLRVSDADAWRKGGLFAGMDWQLLPEDHYILIESFTGPDIKHSYRFGSDTARITIRKYGPRVVPTAPEHSRAAMLENIRTRAWHVRENLAHWCAETVRAYRGMATYFPIESSEGHIRKHAAVLRELLHRKPAWPQDEGFVGEIKIFDGTVWAGVTREELFRALAARGFDFA